MLDDSGKVESFPGSAEDDVEWDVEFGASDQDESLAQAHDSSGIFAPFDCFDSAAMALAESWPSIVSDEPFDPCPPTVKTPRLTGTQFETPADPDSLLASTSEIDSEPTATSGPVDSGPTEIELEHESVAPAAAEPAEEILVAVASSPARSTTLESVQKSVLVEEVPSELEPLDEEVLARMDKAMAAAELGEPFLTFESFPPVVAEVGACESKAKTKSVAASPEQRARRHSLRRFVGVAMGVATLLVVGVSIKAAVSSPNTDSAPQAAIGVQLSGTGPLQQAAKFAVEPTSTPSQGRNPFMDEPTSAASEPTLVGANDGAESEQSSGPVAELRSKTVQLLSQYKLSEAIISARSLIAAEPDNAFGYLCLGAGYQDQGKVAQARAAYSECVRHATRGNIGECAALGGRK